MEPIKQQDILQYKFLSGVRYAPGGERAAFVVARSNEEENTYEQRLWLYEQGKTRQLTDLGKEGGFLWIDDHRLIFPAVRSAKEKKRAEAKEEFTAYYVLDVDGGEAVPYMTLPFAVSGIRMLEKDLFLVTATVDKTQPMLYAASEEEKTKARKKKEEEKDYEVFTELPFWANGEGVTNGSRTLAFLVDREPLRIVPLMKSPEDLICQTVAGDEILLAYIPWQVKRPITGFCLRTVNFHTGETREPVDNWSLMPHAMEYAGGKVLLMATEGARHGLNENAWVYTLDPADGSIQVLREEEYSMYNSVGSDCRLGGGRQAVGTPEGLYHLTTREGNAVLHLLKPDGEDLPVYTGEGAMDCFDVANGKLLCVGLYDMRLQELYTAALGENMTLTKVSSFNDEALKDRYVAQPEPITVQSRGLEIGGWILKPKDYDPNRKYPGILDVHGGPKTVYGPVFYHEMQLWANMGYFVFFCNPKGSDGRDNHFMDIRGRYGDTDFANLMDFTDAVLERYPQIDRDRLCETGGSYGGFMTNWIIGHTDRFCCAASQRSISNWLSFYGISDIGFYFAADQTDGDLYESPEKLWAQSPLKYAGNVTTPTLFIHSDEDYRCPMAEGIQMYAALVDIGVEARLCLFHGENHELSRSGKPKHRQRRLQEITDWFEQHTR
ncbi:MAG: S9 family peptidase [Oscillospiraceae bacterium]|nr:S9 family peptidase [Oscillospiraceae bacterium]